MATEWERRLEDILAGFPTPARDIPFESVIRVLCNVRVEAFDCGLPGNGETLMAIEEAIKETCRNVQAEPIRRARPNEVGNDMEPFVIRALRRQHLKAGQPKTTAGRGKSTGYPDIRIDRPGSLPIYLEAKTYARKNRDTTQRSFYLSPSDEPRVADTAHHLLVGFEIEREGNFYRPVAYEIVDLFGLECDLKSEFNSDNRRLWKRVGSWPGVVSPMSAKGEALIERSGPGFRTGPQPRPPKRAGKARGMSAGAAPDGGADAAMPPQALGSSAGTIDGRLGVSRMISERSG